MKFSIIRCFSSSSSSSSSYTSSEISSNKYNRGTFKIYQNVHAFTYNELKSATNNFRSSNKIGEGGFGCVYKGTLEDGRVVAVKVLSVESKQGDREFMAEIASLSNVFHQNLVNLRGGCIEGASRILVYDYTEKDNLAQTVLGGKEKRVKFSWKVRREICLGIGRGLAHIHEEIKPHIVHRDIKASNILLDRNFVPKISDFGLSKLFHSTKMSHISTRVAGTLGYLAPEYAMSGHLTRKSDVYSYGVLLLEIISGRSAIDFDLEFGEHYLVEKAWEMYKSNKLVDLVDPVLEGNFSEPEAVRLMTVALLCVQQTCGQRPHMSTAIKMMQDDQINIDGLNVSPPGLIKDIMDIKIAERCSTPSFPSSAWSPNLFPFH